MKQLIKLLLITLLFTSLTLFAEIFHKPDFDPRLSIEQGSLEWWNHADNDSASAFNIGLLYDLKIKDYKLAELWYKQALNVDSKNKNALINLGLLYHNNLNKPQKAEFWYKKYLEFEPNNSGGLFNLALLYEAKLNNPTLAMQYYKKAYTMGSKEASNNLGLLYEHQNNHTKAKEWYLKAIERESLSAIKNLGRLYHYKLHDDVKATTYFIALIGKKYSKGRILGYLKDKWNLSDETIKQGYEAQLNSKIIPEKLKYKGGI
ncbi:tetratricopeptide repeat protein [Sulfurimonas sp.]|uniref:tetratricopeptide repeat protein n=1 Tax=Sulfurimonas sp. TaxID=2022749 RepID=UPI003D0AC136